MKKQTKTYYIHLHREKKNKKHISYTAKKIMCIKENRLRMINYQIQ